MGEIKAEVKKQEHLGEIEEMKVLIEKDRQERTTRCQQKVEKALQEENCILDVSAILTVPTPINPQGIRFNINIIPKQ
jgi:hypothetical protein